MHPSGKLPEPVNPPILNLGCRLDTIFANFKHIISLLLFLWAPVHYSIIVFKTLCTHVPEGYFRAMIARSTTNWKQNRNKRKKAKKKLLLVEFIWLAKYCILSWNRNSYPLSFHYFPHGHNDCVERRQFSGAEFQVPSEVWIMQGRENNWR